MTRYLIPLLLLSLLPSCAKKATTPETSSTLPEPVEAPVFDRPGAVPGNAQSQLPKATAFKMSGDYADHVAVTPGHGTPLAYYPAPSDISASSAPIQLEGGWWLNRQGISSNSVFITYTFSEYAALKETPSVETLLESIIPGAKVTEFVVLPYSINDASSHIPEINAYLKDK